MTSTTSTACPTWCTRTHDPDSSPLHETTIARSGAFRVEISQVPDQPVKVAPWLTDSGIQDITSSEALDLARAIVLAAFTAEHLNNGREVATD